jgi:hypothetical protein
MTTPTHEQQRLDLRDVRAISLTCEFCHTCLSLPLGSVDTERLPRACMGCGAPWFTNSEVAELCHLAFAVQELGAVTGPTITFQTFPVGRDLRYPEIGCKIHATPAGGAR